MKKLSPSTAYILKAFLPYSRANMQLAFSPSKFFYELEKKDRVKPASARNAYYRAIKKGLLTIDNRGTPRLTDAGRNALTPYKPQRLRRGAKIMVIFDIPESERYKRNHLRALLRELGFKKVQQSVWTSEFECRDYLASEIKDYGLENYVAVYESYPIEV